MSKAVQEPVQGRDEAVQPIVTFKTPVRGPDERAFLVSERSAAWGRREVSMPPIVEPTFEPGSLGPMPIEWTHDLVHCRLITVHALMQRLPRIKVPAVYRSFLGDLQPQAAGALCRALTPEQITRLDWTWERVCAWPEDNRAVLMGVMAGKSLRLIAKITAHLAALGVGKALTKSTVARRYGELTALMAEEWKVLREPVDLQTREAWLSIASKKK